MKNKMNKIVCGLFAMLILATSIFVTPALAAGPRTGSITVNYIDDYSYIQNDEYHEEKVLIDGATFVAVLVARQGNGRFEWVDKIEDSISFRYKPEAMFDDFYTEDVAEDLIDIVKTLPRFEAKTDKNGKCVFSDLEEGIYLVWEVDKEGTAERYHYSKPGFAEVPNRRVEPNEFDVDTFPKPSRITERMISVTGCKRWKGNDVVGKPPVTDGVTTPTGEPTEEEEIIVYRPESITLRLYANGKEVGVTTTNSEKGWAFSFDGVNALDSNGHEVVFSVREDKVEGYTFTQDKPIIGENTVVINVMNTVGDPAAKTGDETNLGMWLAIIAGCAIFIVVVLLIPSKKKDKRTIAEKIADKQNCKCGADDCKECAETEEGVLNSEDKE